MTFELSNIILNIVNMLIISIILPIYYWIGLSDIWVQNLWHGVQQVNASQFLVISWRNAINSIYYLYQVESFKTSLTSHITLLWPLVKAGAYTTGNTGDLQILYQIWTKVVLINVRTAVFIGFFTMWSLYNLHKLISAALRRLLELESGALTVLATFVAALAEAIHWLSK